MFHVLNLENTMNLQRTYNFVTSLHSFMKSMDSEYTYKELYMYCFYILDGISISCCINTLLDVT